MVKKSKCLLKSKSKIISRPKKNLDIKNSKRDRRKIINKLYDKNEFETDLSFIDIYEENEKKRLKIKENENLIKILNKISYILQICYRPITNNIELVGEYLQNQENNININNIKNNNDHCYNKCSYLLIQNNIVIAPILNTNILNVDLNHNNNKIINNLDNKKNKKKFNLDISKNKKNQITKKTKHKQFLYVHICKNNLINCLLLNEYSLINYILIFLSGIYSGYFAEKNKNNSSVLKVDSFNLFLNNNNSINNQDFYNIEVIGNGKDEYGEYILKGNMSLIHSIEQYQKENENININNNKVIYFGNITFHKIYNI